MTLEQLSIFIAVAQKQCSTADLAQPYRDGAYELRLMIATAAALACCATGLMKCTSTKKVMQYRPHLADDAWPVSMKPGGVFG